jgi:hypothetical protein
MRDILSTFLPMTDASIDRLFPEPQARQRGLSERQPGEKSHKHTWGWAEGWYCLDCDAPESEHPNP